MTASVERFPRRAERARTTRQRVLRAAIDCFVESGYPTTTMADIAERAGVAVQTLYASFKTKRAILAAAIDVAIAGDDEPVPVNERPWMQPVWQATTGPSTLRAYAGAVLLIQQRTAALFRALDVAAASEPELQELWRVSRERRRLGAGGVVKAAARRTPLLSGLTVKRATDIVWMFNGHDMYLGLVGESGWSAAAYERWLGDTLATLLFGTD
jgi:TetR/AcrR family transcriptional regulator of autoinduction and epiphytic fitness